MATHRIQAVCTDLLQSMCRLDPPIDRSGGDGQGLSGAVQDLCLEDTC
jgi:hypothetical protein